MAAIIISLPAQDAHMPRISNDDWGRIQVLFDQLCDLAPARQQEELQECGLSAPLQAELASLLAAHAMDGLLDGPIPAVSEDSAAPYSSLEPGSQIGAFRIVSLVGRGGMGEVYEATRADGEFAQRVAIKLLRPEAVEHAAQFSRERRVLAGLEHPGIARLIDGGITPDGRAYMAMEFVEGRPIDVACQSAGTDLAGRLDLFLAVCDAVAYAHARLIIHRDLKPSNIMVDNGGRVRLLDFGVAGLLEDSGQARVLTIAMVTPDYAAPEQLANGVTTIATDIHALGAVLYHLLAGQAPWGFGNTSVPSIIRRIMHEDPVLPSKVAAAGHPVAASAIAGDLDAIVMKAMRRAPEDRYPTVAALMDDLRRHIDHRPVLAREGSARYMAGRFVRRYKWAVAASAAAVIALLVGAAGIAWQARQTAIERDVALAEARRSESINRMLTVMFRDTAAGTAGDSATVKQMLDHTAEQLVASVDTSARSATLITSLSDLYVNMEDNVAADTLLRRAMARGIGKDDPVAMAEIQLRLASTAAALGKTAEMAPLLDSAEAVFRADPARYRYEMVELTNARAQLARRSGDVPGAIRLLTGNLPDAEAVYAENHRDLLTLYNNLLVYMIEANQLDAMPAIFTRADAALARTGQAGSMQGLGITQLKGMRLLKLDKPAQALPLFESVATNRRARFGKSAGLAVDLLQLSRAKMALGDFAGARAILTEARPMAIDKLGPGAVPTLVMGLGLAESMAETGDAAEALHLLDDIAPLVTAMPKPGPPQGLLLRSRAVVYLMLGRTDQAQVLADQATALFKGLGPAGLSYLKAMPTLQARIAGRQASAISR
jgi:non-specific serine/threonine protein kinase/serine/threonine-protein kinase